MCFSELPINRTPLISQILILARDRRSYRYICLQRYPLNYAENIHDVSTGSTERTSQYT